MKHNIIQTDNYLLIVDDSEIKEGDFLYSVNNKLVVCANKESAVTINSKSFSAIIYKKIIAHLPLNNSPILEGVDLLPPLEQEDDVEKLAKEYSVNTSKIEPTGAEEFGKYWGFKEGYNKAKEKYKWTDEDVIKIVEKSRETGLTAEYLLLTMSQPKYPIGFEQGNIVNDKTYTSVTRRNDDFTLWIGKYIY
jgi:hypothetical protein